MSEDTALRAHLEDIERDTSTMQRLHQRATRLAEIRKSYESSGNDERAEQLQWEISVLFFTRMNLGPLRDGSRVAIWDDQLIIPDKGLDYLEKRVKETHNPIHRSIYADFLWKRGRGSIVETVRPSTPVYCYCRNGF